MLSSQVDGNVEKLIKTEVGIFSCRHKTKTKQMATHLWSSVPFEMGEGLNITKYKSP